MLVLADTIKIEIGQNVWTVGLDVIMYIVIAAIVGVVAETVVGWRVPFGIIGAIIAGVIGVWLMTRVINITGIGDYYLFGVPVFRGLIGAIILISLWHLLTGSFDSHRRHYRTV